MALDMDLARYVEMEAGGRILVLTARKAGELIGYYVWLLGTPLHHRSMLCAHTDMYWLKRDCRRGFTGVRMFRESERYLKAMGVKKLFSTTRPVLDIGRIFDRLRWEKAETVYSKFIGSE